MESRPQKFSSPVSCSFNKYCVRLGQFGSDGFKFASNIYKSTKYGVSALLL